MPCAYVISQAKVEMRKPVCSASRVARTKPEREMGIHRPYVIILYKQRTISPPLEVFRPRIPTGSHGRSRIWLSSHSFTLEKAIVGQNTILMFCVSVGEGAVADRTLPGAPRSCIRIGVCTGTGTRLSWCRVTRETSSYLAKFLVAWQESAAISRRGAIRTFLAHLGTLYRRPRRRSRQRPALL